MNQITRIIATANHSAAVGYAKKLAMQGKPPSVIGIMVRAAGYRLTDADAASIWQARQDNEKAFRAALEAAE